ncbi:hypothetical protein [Elioraea rosea]|uniref:hypothetical protein n=1 Tax=Elioraea rosea TaxID=2492390 RepID=UPI0011856DF5|nr:hypothetical protein [Elioraea rosea]
MEQDFGTALPQVQGFTFQEGGTIPNSDKFDPTNRPNGRQWQAMLAQIRETGDKTSETTHSGSNHPCQTDDYRCDQQGGVSGTDRINTQVQVGGVNYYTRKKYKNANESTSVTVVHISSAAYGNSLVKEALAQAHDYSFKTNKVVVLTLSGGSSSVATSSTSTARSRSFTCRKCGKNYQAPDAIELGVKLNSYPPSCGKVGCSIVRDW